MILRFRCIYIQRCKTLSNVFEQKVHSYSSLVKRENTQKTLFVRHSLLSCLFPLLSPPKPLIFFAAVNILFVAAVNHPGNIHWFPSSSGSSAHTWKTSSLWVQSSIASGVNNSILSPISCISNGKLVVASLKDPHIPTGAAYVQRDGKGARCLTYWPLCKHPCDTFPPYD